MALKWPNKDPDSLLDYSIDWSRWLESNTITSVIWYVQTDGLAKTEFTVGSTITDLSGGEVTDSFQLTAVTNTTTVTTVYLSGGVANRKYTLTCKMTDSTGSSVERSVYLTTREQ